MTTVFVELPGSKIELLEPLGENSPIANFLQAIPTAACIISVTKWTTSIAARDRMLAQGARLTGTAEPRIGAHGKPVLFLHPKDFVGTLIELEQA